jgi:hypothetical protein
MSQVQILTWRVKGPLESGVAIAKTEKRSPTELPLPFDYDEQGAEENLTSWSGVPVLLQAFRSLGVPQSVKRHVAIKQRERGLDEASYVESFVVLNAVGGECLDDFEALKQDQALQELIGHAIPSPEAARKFLYQFHEEASSPAAPQLPLGASFVPEENPRLRGLGQVNAETIQELGRRCPDQKIATIDLDATVIESWKREAQPTYQGVSGYQPMLALWAEMNVIVADEFRDGNVAAHTGLLRVAKQAYASLPDSVQEWMFRGDAACYEQSLLQWLRNPRREGGPQGTIQFAVSARMSESLRERIVQQPQSRWKPYRQDSEVECECVDVFGWDPMEERGLDPVRYVGIRIKRRQGELFGDGSEYKYFAVVTNMWKCDARHLLEWHREKAGSVEAAHDVLKNELAAGVLPCGRFGANAAWFRMAVLTYNVMTALKRLALPPELLTARPKRLRFLIFNTAGRVIHHARALICRCVRAGVWRRWRDLKHLLPLPA